MVDRFTYDVFLSHNAKDKPRVRGLAERLRAAGLRVGTEHGLDEARAQVLCLSPAALGSEWVALERSTVLFRDPTNAGRRFIPLLLANCDLPDALRRYKYVDYRRNTKVAFEELLAACRSETESAAPAPEAKPAKKPAHPPDGGAERRGHNPLDERDPLSREPEGQDKPPDRLRGRAAGYASGVEAARSVLPSPAREGAVERRGRRVAVPEA
jgi:hypothetical protein